MVRLFLIRHAAAAGNVNRFFQGRTDSSLAELGLKQLPFLTKRFEACPPDVVYASPLHRAIQTAEAVAFGKPISIEKGLIEVDGGVLEGVPVPIIYRDYADIFDKWDNHPEEFAPPDGESMPAVYERMRIAMTDIIAKNDGKTVAVVSHGCAIRNYVCFLHGAPVCELNNYDIGDNTAVTEVLYEPAPRIVALNSIEHIPIELRTQTLRNALRQKEAVN